MDTDSALAGLDARITPVRRLLTEAFKTKAISKDAYFKGLLQIAYEYAVAGYADETLSVVLGIEPTYFRSVSSDQMVDDPQFHKQAEVVAEVLAATGLTSMTQRVAHA